jgi:sugar phosphate isomerase/epimerase
MKRLLSLSIVFLTLTANAQLVGEHRGSDDFQIAVAGFSYRSFDIDQTLRYLKSMDVRYFSVKDWWLPLDATKEQMDAFKAKCAEQGIEGYILGPIYMKTEAEVDRAFAYAARYGSNVFIGETGIRVAIHTHGPDGAPFPNIQKVVELVKDPSLGVGCCMDLGHSIRMGDDIVHDIIAYKEWIYDIHIKDETAASPAGQTWEMGRGVIDFAPVIRALRYINYQGKVALEFEKNGKDPHAGIAESIGYLRAVMDLTR